jgi:hypothetical protein
MTYLTYFLKKKDYNSIIKKYDLLNLFFKKKDYKLFNNYHISRFNTKKSHPSLWIALFRL